MAVRTRDELLASIKNVIGDDTSENALNLLTDVRDTLDRQDADENGVPWKKRYEDNDATWRTRYRDAFFKTPEPLEDDEGKGSTSAAKPNTFESLFKEV